MKLLAQLQSKNEAVYQEGEVRTALNFGHPVEEQPDAESAQLQGFTIATSPEDAAELRTGAIYSVELREETQSK